MAHSHMTEMLDLDAEVLHDYHREVITWAGSLTPARAQIVDLGAGSGAGTLALAQHLPEAQITAVDVDEDMLAHLRHRAEKLGVAGRIRTVQANLDESWPALDTPVDLVWASASMHHMADPVRTLSQARQALRPGGVVLITELQAFPRFLTDSAGTAVEDRCHAAMAERRAEAGMHMDDNWADRLTKAGLTVEAERRFDIALHPPLPAVATRYAEVTFERMQTALEDRLTPEDRSALADITATIRDREDLLVRTTRTVWVARRPS